jgi:mannosyltransferase OCH1-like enzyme
MIPAIIHHYWVSRDPFKKKYHAWRESWMKFNPTYSMYFWTLDNIPYNWMLPDSVKILKSDAIYILKSDILRWEILKIFGGIVVDCDMECRKNFDAFLTNESFCAKGWGDNTYGNQCVGSLPGNTMCNDILGSTAAAAFNNWEKANSRKIYKYGILQAVPHLVKCSRIYERETFYPFPWDAVDHDDTAVLNRPYPDSYAIHWWTGMNQDGWCKETERRDKACIPPPMKP